MAVAIVVIVGTARVAAITIDFLDTVRNAKLQTHWTTFRAEPVHVLVKTILVEEDNLQAMWAGLLAGGAVKDGSTDDLLLYADILKSLTVFQGQLVDLIYGDTRLTEVVAGVAPPYSNLVESAFEHSGRSVYNVDEVLKKENASLGDV